MKAVKGRLLLALSFLLSAYLTLGWSAAQAIFLTRLGIAELPDLFLLTALASVPVALAYSSRADRWEKGRAYRNLLWAGVAASLASWGLLETPWRGAPIVLSIVVFLVQQLHYAQFWLFAGEFLTSLEVRESSGAFTVAMSLGGIAGGTLTLGLLRWLHAESLLGVYALLLAACVIVLREIERRVERTRDLFADEERRTEPGLATTFRMGRHYPIIRILTFSTLFLIVVLRGTQYLTDAVFLARFPGAERLAGFYGRLGAGFSAFELLLGIAVVRPLFAAVGVRTLVLLYPVCALAALFGLGMHYGLPTAVVAAFVAEPLANVLYYPTEILLYNAVPRRLQGAIRGVNEGVVHPIGMSLAGGALLFLQGITPSKDLALGTALVGIVSLFLALRLRKEYPRGLLTLLKDRNLDLDSLTAGAGGGVPPDVLQRVRDLAHGSDPAGSVFALEFVERARPPGVVSWIPSLLDPRRPVEVRRGALRALRALVWDADPEETRQIANAFRRAIADPDPRVRGISLDALISMGWKGDGQALPLGDPDPRVRADACLAAYRFGAEGDRARAHREILRLGRSKKTELRMAAAKVARALGDPSLHPVAVALERDPEARVREMALLALKGVADERARREGVLAGAVDADPRVRAAAAALAGEIPVRTSAPILLGLLGDTDVRVQQAAAREAPRLGEPYLPQLLARLEGTPGPSAAVLLEALGRTSSPASRARLKAFCRHALGRATEARRDRWALGDGALLPPSAQAAAALEPLEMALQDLERQSISLALRALVASGAGSQVLLRSLESEDERLRADALEAVSSLEDREVMRLVLPLLQSSRPHGPHRSIPDLIVRRLRDADPWIQASAAYAVVPLGLVSRPEVRSALQEAGGRGLLAALEGGRAALRAAQGKPSAASRARMRPSSARPAPEGARPPAARVFVMERLLLLKKVPIFSSLGFAQLEAIDAIAYQEEFLPDEMIFREGEPGDRLYIVLEGKVDIVKGKGPRRGGRVLASLGPPAYFGEMALFDDSPRSAAAVARSKTRLLVIGKGRFKGMLLERPEMALEMCKVLTARLRIANESLERATQPAPVGAERKAG